MEFYCIEYILDYYVYNWDENDVSETVPLQEKENYTMKRAH